MRWVCLIDGTVAHASNGEVNEEQLGRWWVRLLYGKRKLKNNHPVQCVLGTVLSFAVLLLVDGEVFFLVVPQLCRIGVQW